MRTINYSMLPEHMQGAAMRYIEQGVHPGSFMYRVLANDLVGAFGHADASNTVYMSKWADWLYNECPSHAWGNEKLVDEYIRNKQREREHERPTNGIDNH